MLIRDLELTPREVEHYFSQCWVELTDGSGLYIQQATERSCDPAGTWFCFHYPRCGEHTLHSDHTFKRWYRMDEFEAQMVLDFFAPRIKNLATKPSGDT